MSGAVLFSEMIPHKDWEHRFNDWYDTEHIPIRMEVPGFRKARRYSEKGSLKYLAVYEMESPEVLESEDYRYVKENPSELTRWMLSSVSGFSRYIGTQISEQTNPGSDENAFDAPILYSVMFQVPPEREREFNDWYEQDHLPTLLKNSNWLACRRYRIGSGTPGPWTHLALHYLANTGALESEERKEARSSAWREKLAQEPWFKGEYMIFHKKAEFTGKFK